MKVSNKGVSDCCAIMPSAPSDVLALSDESDQGGGRSRPSRLPTVEELSDEEPTKFKPDPTSQGSKGLKRKVDSKLAKPVSRHAVRVKIFEVNFRRVPMLQEIHRQGEASVLLPAVSVSNRRLDRPSG